MFFLMHDGVTGLRRVGWRSYPTKPQAELAQAIARWQGLDTAIGDCDHYPDRHVWLYGREQEQNQ
jgi:hypothetical protein